MSHDAPGTPTPAQLVRAAAAQGWPPSVVDLVATLAIADIPHRIEPEHASRLKLSLPEEHTAATGLAADLWLPTTPSGWRSTWLNHHGCHLLASRLRLPTTSQMYLQPPTTLG